MEWLAVITMLCSSKIDLDTRRPDCEEYHKKCVEWVYAHPETKARGVDKDTIAVLLLTKQSARKKLCR